MNSLLSNADSLQFSVAADIFIDELLVFTDFFDFHHLDIVLENQRMQIRASESINEGDLVCLATGPDGSTVLLCWRFGCEAIGIAARLINEDEIVEYSPEKSSDDILVKGSSGPANNRVVAIKAACDLKVEDLVCLKLLPDGNLLIDKWEYGQEAVGIAARDIREDEVLEFCEGESTDDIHVKPH